MSTALQLRRGTTANHSAFTGLLGELTIDTTKKTAVVHDGATAGGVPLSTEAFATAAANAVSVAMTALIGSSVSPPGLIASFMGIAAPAGWVKANGTTIGNASSGATQRANADTAALFAVLWDLNSAVSVITTSAGGASTRGASAAADYAANKRLSVPDWRGEFLRGADDGRGVDTSRLVGSAQSEMVGPHTHAIRASVTGWTGGNAGVVYANGDNNGNNSVTGAGATYGIQNNTGTENRPRNVAGLVCVKL